MRSDQERAPQLEQRSSTWQAIARCFVVLALLAAAGCKIRPPTPYWIETHGQAVGSRIAGWSNGVLLIDGNHQFWAYPGHWSQPWLSQSTTRGLRAVAASNTTAYGLTTEGQLFRFAGNQWSQHKGTETENMSELAVTDDDRLLVLTNGKLKQVNGQTLQALDCDSVVAVAVAGGAANEAYVLDQKGALYLDAMGRCDAIPVPAPLRRIAGRPDRLLAITTDGSIWRRRAGAWTRLPQPSKYRAGQDARATRANDVALSAYTTWLLDNEGSVFVLSDET